MSWPEGLLIWLAVSVVAAMWFGRCMAGRRDMAGDVPPPAARVMRIPSAPAGSASGARGATSIAGVVRSTLSHDGARGAASGGER